MDQMEPQTGPEKPVGSVPPTAPIPRKAIGNQPANGAQTSWATSSGQQPFYKGHHRNRRPFSNMSTRRRRIIVISLILLLLVFIIGLSVGLAKRSHGTGALPLPGPGNHTGDITYYTPGMGACGYQSTANQSVVAIGHATFDAVQNGGNPNNSPLCGKQIRISRVNQNGTAVSVTATVVDRCVGCGPTDLDVAPSVFDQLAAMGDGRVQASWEWL